MNQEIWKKLSRFQKPRKKMSKLKLLMKLPLRLLLLSLKLRMLLPRLLPLIQHLKLLLLNKKPRLPQHQNQLVSQPLLQHKKPQFRTPQLLPLLLLQHRRRQLLSRQFFQPVFRLILTWVIWKSRGKLRLESFTSL